MRHRIVIVSDKLLRDYRYVLSAPAGRDFDPQIPARFDVVAG